LKSDIAIIFRLGYVEKLIKKDVAFGRFFNLDLSSRFLQKAFKLNSKSSYFGHKQTNRHAGSHARSQEVGPSTG